jgi:hypothetical protein
MLNMPCNQSDSDVERELYSVVQQPKLGRAAAGSMGFFLKANPNAGHWKSLHFSVLPLGLLGFIWRIKQFDIFNFNETVSVRHAER